jgi:hypothetical protein
MISDTIIKGDPNLPASAANGDDLNWTRFEATLGLRYLL